jgi:hypothetical protein
VRRSMSHHADLLHRTQLQLDWPSSFVQAD